MKLAHILVCHTTDPSKAVASIPPQSDSPWYVFLHSDDARCQAVAETLIRERDANVFAYGVNRGLARSWNEGLHLAMEASCDAALLLNDDLFFYEGGYAAFRNTIEALRGMTASVAYATPLGLESGTGSTTGRTIPQQFACCAIMRETVELIGYFDENFTPAYYEDVDYDRRALLAGMYVHVDDRVLVEHERSSTMSSMSELDRENLNAAHMANAGYYTAKWGPQRDWLRPFNGFDLKIPFAAHRSPYGVGCERRVATPDASVAPI